LAVASSALWSARFFSVSAHRALAPARISNKPEITVPSTTEAATAPSSAATAGFHRHHRHAFFACPTGRALIGSSFRLHRRLAGQEAGAVELAGFVECDDMGVNELGGTAGFAQEALNFLGIRQRAGSRELQRNRPFQLAVANLVDRAESANAETLQELELAQPPWRLGR
jgi:hypothetical protein